MSRMSWARQQAFGGGEVGRIDHAPLVAKGRAAAAARQVEDRLRFLKILG
jgi:hypothetical protein